MNCSDLASSASSAGASWEPNSRHVNASPTSKPSVDELSFTLASLSWPLWRAGGIQLQAPWGLAVPDGRISFYVCREGSGYLISPLYQSPLLLKAGDVMLLPGAGAHSLRDVPTSRDVPFEHAASLPSSGPSDAAAHGAPVPGATAAFLYGQLPIQELGFNPLQGRLPAALHLPGNAAGMPLEWEQLIGLISRELQMRQPGWEAIVRQLMRTLFHQTIRSRLSELVVSPSLSGENGGDGAGSNTADPAIRLVVGLLHAELGKPWTVTSLARWIHMSRSAFSARFREVVGQPPLQYLTEVRMQRACELLCESNLGIKQIATAVGYESPSSFTNAFKRWQGVSPIGYRIKHAPDLAHSLKDSESADT